MASNTVTFYQGDQGIGGMRVGPMMVEVEGLWAPWLELVEIVRHKGPTLNRARFGVRDYDGIDLGRFEDVAQVVQSGQRVTVSMVYQDDPASGRQGKWCLFAGVVSSGSASISGKGEGVEVVACDEMTYRDAAAIEGVRALGYGGEAVFIETAGVVFNPDGQPNGSGQAVEVNGKAYQVFELEPSKAKYWTYASAIEYLVYEGLGVDGIAGLEALTEGKVLRDVEVTGLTALAAIDRLCRRAGLGYCVVEVPVRGDQVKAVLEFYRRGQGRRIFLQHQPSGESLDMGRTNLLRCKLDLARVRESVLVRGQGDLKKYEATFELVGGWDPALEFNDYDLYSPATNENFLEVKDVFRKWVLNESGDYSGEAFDFRGIFGSENYALRRRRFWGCLSRDASGKSLGYYVEVSYNGGEDWRPYAGAFDVLLEECGIYLSVTQFDSASWYAIKKDMLRFRITASVVGDERVEANVSDGPMEASRRVRVEVMNLGNEFKYRQVTPASIFYGGGALGEPDVRDDREVMRSLLRDEAGRMRQGSMKGVAELPFVRGDIRPGDVVWGIEGREVDFRRCIVCGEHRPQVEKVTISTGRKWSTAIEFGGG